MPLSDHVLASLREWLDKQLERITSLPWVKDGLVDEVVLRLLVADASRVIESPYAYARTILRNLVRDRIRSLERMQAALEAIARQRLAECGTKSDTSKIDDGDLVRHLLRRSSLSPLQERVIHMMYMEGKSLSSVASALSRNPGTIRQHHDRAIRKLAEQAACLGGQP